MHQPAGRRHQ